jgi:CDP-diacylglycerol---glycerol-3-phosphate 3-phosphatidyltransferase
VKHLPNLLTALRLVLSLFVFFALAETSENQGADWGVRTALQFWAFVAFAVAAVTDFFDGWLARRYDAVSIAGAILDPIADKVLICAAILGLMALVGGSNPALFVIPAGLILFREFAVSALREVAAARSVKLPVTLLAKWKTTFQLVALGAEMVVGDWPAFGLPAAWLASAALVTLALLWLACIVTLITGGQYGVQAYRALSATRP